EVRSRTTDLMRGGETERARFSARLHERRWGRGGLASVADFDGVAATDQEGLSVWPGPEMVRWVIWTDVQRVVVPPSVGLGAVVPSAQGREVVRVSAATPACLLVLAGVFVGVPRDDVVEVAVPRVATAVGKDATWMPQDHLLTHPWRRIVAW